MYNMYMYGQAKTISCNYNTSLSIVTRPSYIDLVPSPSIAIIHVARGWYETGKWGCMGMRPREPHIRPAPAREGSTHHEEDGSEAAHPLEQHKEPPLWVAESGELPIEACLAEQQHRVPVHDRPATHQVDSSQEVVLWGCEESRPQRHNVPMQQLCTLK